MSIDDQINKLNSVVKFRIAPSKIHGVGVFAISDIFKGQKLWATEFPQAYKISPGSLSKLFPEVKELLLERNCQMVNGTPFMWPDCHAQAYMNHSDDPNYDANLDYALRDIVKNEEITENYKLIPGHEEVFPWLK